MLQEPDAQREFAEVMGRIRRRKTASSARLDGADVQLDVRRKRSCQMKRKNGLSAQSYLASHGSIDGRGRSS